MAGFNRVVLLGNLTRDPQLKYLPNNTAVCEFGLAVNRRWRDRDGNQREDVCFVDMAAFGRPGETINQYMSKGRQILVEGRLKFDSWTSQDGTKRSKLSVVVENFTFVGTRDASSGGVPAGTRDGRQPAPLPQAPGLADAPPMDEEPPSGDDIPF
jgi:single-strand DNA-binding protein